jgi:homoserine kinase
VQGEWFPPNSVCVIAPSTTANLGPGFDVFGLALDLSYDRLEVSLDGSGVSLEVSSPFRLEVPSDPSRNTAGVVARLLLERAGKGLGVRMRLVKGVRPGCGLGSSGASAAAAAVALNELLGLGLSRFELVSYAAKGEAASAGAAHADNVSPAILGGFTLVRSYDPLDVLRLRVPGSLMAAVVIPEIEVPEDKTRIARSILPREVPLPHMVRNVGNAAGMVAGLLQSDIGLIGRCMSDRVVEPVRARLIPGYEGVKRAAVEAGASGVTISGAGPAMLAVVDSEKVSAEEVAEAMREAFEREGLSAESHAARASSGARIVGRGCE